MKKSVLLILLMIFSRLWSMANTKEDVDALFYLGLNGKNLAPDSIVTIGKRMFIISEDLNYSKGVMKARVIQGIGHLFSNQLDSSSTQLLAVLQLAERSNMEVTFESGLAKNFLGSVFTRLNNLERAKQCFRDARQIFEEVNNKSYLCLATTNLGGIFGQQGSYPEAMNYFLAAKKLANDPTVPIRRKAEAMSNMSTLFSLMGKKEEALRYAFSTLAIDREHQLMRGVYISHNLIANIYNRYNDLDSALFYYNLNIETIPSGNPRFTPVLTRAIRGISHILIEQNKLDEAIRLLKKLEAKGVNYQKEAFYNAIASNYLKSKQYDSTLFYARIALSIAQANKVKSGSKYASQHLQQAYFHLKAFDSAYYYQRLCHIYNDSIYNESNERKFNNSLIALATLEKQQEIDKLRQERVIDRLNGRITTGSLATGILCVLIIFGFYRNKQQTKQKSLQRKLELNQKQLTNHTLNMVHKNNGFTQIEEELKKMRRQGEINFQKLLNIVVLNKSAEKDWDNFHNYFSMVHPDFERKLMLKFPKLSMGERRLTSLVKMKLTNAEIASILNIESNSARMNKYRLKRKLELSEEMDLYDYISNL
ncbi:hypothetical protein FNH22_07800 [Fulvivirga sp. M361]|uniref:tetratricopeptide repeat protein n=1 Tax=Fulvivirga sp. M361 TaxID=2594266 RepID=UPI00117B088D|nr:hypothetical protein [Fulvivirga sp. M361]TRX59948.1 hypothetical protein FNH22_07800 [Fulvivirga sp. M361]